jgi:phosphopantothenoylcysteine decarboxylase/phosphopantothenate--cysteine ligase
MLITAGPTHEPIDAVRYIANRSSGRVGIALADAAARRGDQVTLLLGPTPRTPDDPRVKVRRFQTTAELEALLPLHFPNCDTLIMAAAVADYRPKQVPAGTKLRRTESPLTIDLEPTPDLLAGVARTKRPDQRVIGFALEPQDRLIASAKDKLERKHLDAVVANPLETMDATGIRATLLFRDGRTVETAREIDKSVFAGWLLDALKAG